MLIIDKLSNDIVISRGSKEAVRYTITDALTGLAKNLTGWNWKLTVKADIDDPITSAIFQLTNPLANGIDVALASTGKIDAHFATVHTAALDGDYVYDLEGTEPGQDPQKIFFPPLFRVRKDVTTPGSAPSPPAALAGFASVSIAGALYFQNSVTNGWIRVKNEGGFFDVSPEQVGPPPF